MKLKNIVRYSADGNVIVQTLIDAVNKKKYIGISLLKVNLFILNAYK